MYVDCSKSNASYLFPWKLQQIDHNNTVSESMFSATNHYFSTVATIISAFFCSNEQETACLTCKYLHRQRWSTLAVATAETHYPPSHCAYMHCLVSMNVQQMSINVSGCHFFFCMEELIDTSLLHTRFHVRCRCVRLPLCCHLSHGKSV